MIEKTTYSDGFRQDYIVLDDGTTGTTSAQFIMNTIRELSHKAGLSEKESRMIEKSIWRILEKTDLNNNDTFVEGNWEQTNT